MLNFEALMKMVNTISLDLSLVTALDITLNQDEEKKEKSHKSNLKFKRLSAKKKEATKTTNELLVQIKPDEFNNLVPIISKLLSLRRLNIRNIPLDEIGVKLLAADLPKGLEELKITHCGITDIAPLIANLPQTLRRLILSNNAIADAQSILPLICELSSEGYRLCLLSPESVYLPNLSQHIFLKKQNNKIYFCKNNDIKQLEPLELTNEDAKNLIFPNKGEIIVKRLHHPELVDSIKVQCGYLQANTVLEVAFSELGFEQVTKTHNYFGLYKIDLDNNPLVDKLFHKKISDKLDEKKRIADEFLMACKKKNYELLDELFMEYGTINFCIEYTDNTYGTLFHLAVLENDMNLLNILLKDKNADFNYLNSERQSPIHYAEELKRTEIVNLLLQREKNNQQKEVICFANRPNKTDITEIKDFIQTNKMELTTKEPIKTGSEPAEKKTRHRSLSLNKYKFTHSNKSVTDKNEETNLTHLQNRQTFFNQEITTFVPSIDLARIEDNSGVKINLQEAMLIPHDSSGEPMSISDRSTSPTVKKNSC